jgi:hypothetical protein
VSLGSSIQASGNASTTRRVEERVGGCVDDRPRVEALEVDGLHGAGRDEAGDELLVPGDRRVELEAQRRIALETARDGLQGRRLAEAQRDDERQRPRLASEDRVQRLPGLPQGEVERRGLIAPGAVQPRDVALRLLREEVERRQMLGERPDRPVARERQGGAGILGDLVVDGVVDDVLADALLAVAAELDDGGLAHELA